MFSAELADNLFSATKAALRRIRYIRPALTALRHAAPAETIQFKDFVECVVNRSGTL